MMAVFNFNIDAHNDFELASTIQRRLDYSLEIPETDVKGLVVYIAGFGDDTAVFYQAGF